METIGVEVQRQMAQAQENMILQNALRNRNKNNKVRTRPFSRRSYRDYTIVNGVVVPIG